MFGNLSLINYSNLIYCLGSTLCTKQYFLNIKLSFIKNVVLTKLNQKKNGSLLLPDYSKRKKEIMLHCMSFVIGSKQDSSFCSALAWYYEFGTFVGSKLVASIWRLREHNDTNAGLS